MKEYHVFDAIYCSECEIFRKVVIDETLNRISNGSIGRDENQDLNIVKRLSFIDNPENYFDYFDYLFLKNESVQLVGDITPSYSMLSSNAYNHIKEGLESRGFKVKVVFLMRDPFERIWSMIRMNRKVRLLNGFQLVIDEEEELRDVYYRPEVSLRTRYDRTIEELEKVFDKSDIFYGYYENLFTEEIICRLSEFLSIELEDPDFHYKVNESPKSTLISDGLREEIINYYKSVYKFLSIKSKGYTDSIWSKY